MAAEEGTIVRPGGKSGRSAERLPSRWMEAGSNTGSFVHVWDWCGFSPLADGGEGQGNDRGGRGL